MVHPLFSASVSIDISRFYGKIFKLLADMVRSGIKNQHGFQATKGITDAVLLRGPLIIRFATKRHRDSFLSSFHSLLNLNTLKMLQIHNMCPASTVTKPVKITGNIRAIA
jgi:hypothetical protein